MGIYLLKERVRDGFIVFIFKQSLIDNNKFTTTGESTTGGSSSRGMIVNQIFIKYCAINFYGFCLLKSAVLAKLTI